MLSEEREQWEIAYGAHRFQSITMINYSIFRNTERNQSK